MKHYDLMDRANALWWKTFAEACAKCYKEDPNAADQQVARYALEVADEAREEFVTEAHNFTSA